MRQLYSIADGSRRATYFLDDARPDELRLVKVLDVADAEGLLELETELRLTRDLAAPGVRRALERGELDGRPALWTTHFAGDTLEHAFAGRQPLERVLEVGLRIAEGLAALHAARIVHGHLSPRTIRVDAAFRAIEIAELGRATLGERRGRLELAIGERGPYAAPEETGRMNRALDHRADLYALGAILYELLTGAPPFVADSPLELVHKLIAVEPPPAHQHAPEVPIEVSAVVAKLLAKSPEDRYQTAEGLRRDLERCLEAVQAGHAIPSFTPGEQDHAARFRLPQRVLGREHERALLLDAVERTAAGATSLVLLTGPAGVGKSMLVRELERPLTTHDGRFIEGKFDQFQRDVPFSALSRAFETWVNLVLAESDEELARQRAKILEAADGLGALLTRFVPDLELVLGPQPSVPEVAPSDGLFRFQYVLRRFLASIADEARPLVLFVDDLQWADAASLELLGTLVTGRDAHHLLIVGAYRDDEVAPGHPLVLTLDGLARSAARVDTIPVGPLSHDAIERFVADALADERTRVRPLAAHVAAQTGGNALFVGQLLRAMVEEGTLAWSADATRWEWSLDPHGETRDVLQLIVDKTKRLPEPTRELLVRAALLGNRCSVLALAHVCGLEPVALSATLAPAVREGLLLAIGAGHRFLDAGLPLEANVDASYVFPHDRVQQAVASAVSKEARAPLHLALGRSLRQLDGARIFDVAHQLNLGRRELTDDTERRELATIDRDAALAAKRAGAYAAALEYLTVALELLGDDPWRGQRALALELHAEAAECAYLAAQLDRMERHIDEVLAHGRDILEKIRVYDLRVDAYTSQNRLNDAMRVGREALAELGVRFPKNPKLHHIFAGLGRTKLALVGKNIPALATQRAMTDPKKLEAMLLLERMVPPAYMSGSPLFPLLVFAMVDLSVKYGNSPLSPFGYGSFAITLSGVLGDIRSGEVFGRTALDTLDHLGAETFRSKVHFVLYVFITHWTRHLGECVEPLLEAFHSGMKAGNLVGATWSAHYRLLWLFYTGKPMADLERESATYSGIFAQLGQNAAHRRTDLLRQVMLNLMGRSASPTRLSGETYPEEEIETLSAKGDDATSRFFFHAQKQMLAVLFGELDEAVRHGDLAKGHLEAATGLPDTPLWTFWDALARVRASESLPAGTPFGRREKLRRTARRHLGKLEKWGQFAPMNYAHKHDLVAAELARVAGDDTAARDLYDRAIEGALAHGYMQEAALAAELASAFHRAAGRRELASWYLGRAHEDYLRWGALAKTDALEAAFPELAHVETEGSRAAADLDVASVVKATSALSSEIVLDRLAATLLEIAVENAGAQRGLLVLFEDGEGRVVARRGDSGAVETGLSLPLAPSLAPESVLNYVTRSRRAMVVGDASAESRTARDPYVLRHRVRSVLCVPVVNQGTLLALVYLENNLAADAFDPARVTLLEVIGGQIGISIENARLYRNLQTSLDKQTELTRAYSRFTPRAFLDFLGAESILDVRLGDHRAGDMTVLFGDLRSYTTLSESMSPADNFRFINELLARTTPCIEAHGGVVSEFLGDGVMAFFPRRPEDALHAAIDMQRALRTYNAERRAKGRAPIAMGIGMHTGPLMIGVIGDRDRMGAALVSDTVNTAARMEGLTKELHIAIAASDGTVERIDDAFDRFGLRRVGDVRPKGKRNVVRIYECFDGDDPTVAREKRAAVVEFEHALAAYQAGDFDTAIAGFEAVLRAYSDDATARRYLARAAEYRARGVPEGWTGVEAMERK